MSFQYFLFKCTQENQHKYHRQNVREETHWDGLFTAAIAHVIVKSIFVTVFTIKRWWQWTNTL